MGRTLADDLIDDVTNTFLDTDHFAATYTYTAPRTGTTSSVTGVWAPDEVPDIEVSRGLENCYTGKLHVASSVSVLKDGFMSINSETWQVASVGPPDQGMRVIKLTRQLTSHRANGPNFQ